MSEREQNRCDRVFFGSKYAQVVIPREQWLQIWRDAWQAALADRPEQPLEEWRDDELAASPTPKAQEGTWTLTAPDGRTWQADSPLQCAGKESNERIPPAVQLARIARELAVARPEPAEPVASLNVTALAEETMDKTSRAKSPREVRDCIEAALAVAWVAGRDEATPSSHPAPSEAGADRQESDELIQTIVAMKIEEFANSLLPRCCEGETNPPAVSCQTIIDLRDEWTKPKNERA